MYEIFEQLLQKNKTTTYKVAKDTGISQTIFSNWKSGRSTPKNDKMQKIADYFGVSLEYLMGTEVNEETQYYLNKDARDLAQFMFENPEYKVLFDASRKVKKEDILFVKEMIDRIKGN